MFLYGSGGSGGGGGGRRAAAPARAGGLFGRLRRAGAAVAARFRR